METLFQWLNTHLQQALAPPILSISKLKIIPLLEPVIDNESPLLILFPCSLTPVQAEQLRETVWTELFADLTPGPRPYAVSIQSESLSNTPKKLAVFDMDSTLINEEVIDELARELGLYEQVAQITDEAMQGTLDFKSSLKKRCRLLAGLSKDQALGIIQHLHVSPGAEALLTFFRSQSAHTAVVSGGFEFILKHFQKQLFLDQVYGHSLETMRHPHTDEIHFTGHVEDPIIDANYKQKLVAQLKVNYSCSLDETVVIGDGANDIKMMTEAGTSISFCGKPKLASMVNTLIFNRNLLWVKALIH